MTAGERRLLAAMLVCATVAAGTETDALRALCLVMLGVCSFFFGFREV